jgi:hypothetical protein
MATTEWPALLQTAGDKLSVARAAAESALIEAHAIAVGAIADGQAESTIARLLGVDRMTIRKWAGKR